MKIREAGITLVLARHGESKANRQGIIVSHPLRGIFRYGLTQKAKKEVVQEAERNKEALKDVIIYTSPFLRSRQTAKIIKNTVGSGRIHYSWKLRERNFGTLEGQSNTRYDDVWQLDRYVPDHRLFGVESVTHVAHRTEKLFKKLTRKHIGENVLLVGHGDVLQIAETIYQGLQPQTHRSRDHLAPGEIRVLHQVS